MAHHHRRVLRDGYYQAWLAGGCSGMAMSKEGLKAFDELFPEEAPTPEQANEEYLRRYQSWA